jgi:DNA mismatch endonuclease (patch repair protein)
MPRIRGSDTKPERLIRNALHAKGFRFRVNFGRLPGKPDVVLPNWNVVVLIHGCFWHSHLGYKKATTPSSNVDFWQKKDEANVDRDRRVTGRLDELEWHTLTNWECTMVQDLI